MLGLLRRLTSNVLYLEKNTVGHVHDSADLGEPRLNVVVRVAIAIYAVEAAD
jgi:hypothetical protein